MLWGLFFKNLVMIVSFDTIITLNFYNSPAKEVFKY